MYGKGARGAGYLHVGLNPQSRQRVSAVHPRDFVNVQLDGRARNTGCTRALPAVSYIVLMLQDPIVIRSSKIDRGC